jgi:hypothetical protein
MMKSGRVLFASLLALALGSTAWAQEEKKAEAPAAEFKTRKEIGDWYKKCRTDAKDKAAKKECKKQRKALMKAHGDKLKAAWKALKDARKKARAARKTCKKDKDCKKRFKDWRASWKKWKKALTGYARKGGEAPSWDPPAVPEGGKAEEKKPEEKKE